MPILQFKGKTAVETYHHTVPHHTLEFDSKLSVFPQGRSPSSDDNLIIEGDNLLALKALLPTHAGRIKCIYLDVPYNTGNEGWIYNDNLNQPQFKEWIGQVVGKEEEDACRHDKWCCMMYPRLQLLKELLSDDGALFISIDDNEVHHLRMLMNETFGEENLIASFAIKANPRGRQSDEYVATLHEYLLCYGKRESATELNGLPLTPEDIEEFDQTDPDGEKWRELGLRQRGAASLREDREDMFFPIYVSPTTGTVSLKATKEHCVKVEPKKSDGRESRWMWSPKKVQDEIGRVYGRKVSRRDEFDIFIKDYLNRNDEQRTAKPKSMWLGKEVNTEAGGKLVTRILGEKLFDYPKPVALIKLVLQLATDKTSIVLDSTAGSGTTAHALLELNQDGGNRKFILVQQPYDTKENEAEKFNICREVTAERVRRVIKGYSYKTQKGKTEKVEGARGSFSYARLSDKPLFGEFRDFGSNPPPCEEVAKYVFYTETSQQWNPAKMQKQTGKIGEHAGTSYYLLYSPNQKADMALDAEFLKTTATQDANKKLVVYCEKIWLHRSTLREWEAANGKTVRTMIVPFNLR